MPHTTTSFQVTRGEAHRAGPASLPQRCPERPAPEPGQGGCVAPQGARYCPALAPAPSFQARRALQPTAHPGQRWCNAATLGLLALTALLAPCPARGQTEEIIRAKNVRTKLTIGFDAKSFDKDKVAYQIDDRFDFSDAKPLPDGGTLAIAAADNFTLLTSFANPLVYRVSFSQSVKEDPAVKATRDFLHLFGQLFSQIGAIPSDKANLASVLAPASNNPGTTQKALNKATVSEDTSKVSTVRSPEVLSLLLWLTHNEQAAPRAYVAADNVPEVKSRVKAIKEAMQQAENNLYGFPASTQALVKELVAPVTYPEVQEALKGIREHYDKLRTENGNAEKQLAALKTLGSEGLYAHVKLTEEQALKAAPLETYVRATITTYANTFEEKLKARKELLASLDKLLTSLSASFTEKGYKHEGEQFVIQNRVASSEEAIKQVDIAITRLTLKFVENTVVVSEEKVYASTLRVRPYSLVVLEASAGVLLTSLSYPEFGTAVNTAGQTIVADAGADRVNFVPAALLNVFLLKGRSDALPVFQLGVGTGRDSRPTLFTGLGLRFFHPNKLTFSLGAIFAFQQVLGSLQLDQAVTGTAQVKSDLKYNLSVPKLAFGIQYILN